MMKILVVAATRAEVSGLYAAFDLPENDFVHSAAFDLLITGVGMTATAFALGTTLAAFAYDLVLNLGIAGSFDRGLPLGTVLQVTEDRFSELGAEDKEDFIPLETLGFGESCYQGSYRGSSAMVSRLPSVKGITVNTVHGHKATIETVWRRLQPVTESMEGAAVFYCCSKLKTDCLQVRSLSNYVEERNRENWQIGPALKNLNAWAIDFLTNG